MMGIAVDRAKVIQGLMGTKTVHQEGIMTGGILKTEARQE